MNENNEMVDQAETAGAVGTLGTTGAPGVPGPTATWPDRLVLAVGVGAVGSRIVPWLDPQVALVCCDRDTVSEENLGVAAFDPADARELLGRPKAEVVSERHRLRGGQAQALHGDIRYRVGPGLVAELDAVVLSLDNASAFADVSAILAAAAHPGVPIVIVTCGGGDDERWQVRVFETGGSLCPICMQSPAERQEAASSPGASCAAVEAPRASAVAAEAAGQAGAAFLARVMNGERSLVGCRIQRDGRATAAWSVRMPAGPVPGCPIPHERRERPRIEDLPWSIDEISVGTLAERACTLAGADATFVLGRRAMPLAGFECPACGHRSEAQPRLLPAAAAQARACDCPGALRPLGERRTVAARELLTGPVRNETLRAWGASPGDGFLVVGERASVELRCRLAWEDLARG